MVVWRNPDFIRLWSAQAVSKLGSGVTQTALPLTAVLVLDATPAQMALLVFAGQLPDLIFGLLAGVWIDRVRRRPVLIGADLGRFVLLGSIPIAAVAGTLSFAHLWVVEFGSGILTLFFVVAGIAVLPTIVRADELVEANSKLSMTDAVVSLAGPSGGGALVQLVGAPGAILADALSYLVSAFCIGGVAKSEPAADRPDRRRVWTEISEGVRELLRTPLLRALAISTGVGTLAVAIQSTVSMLYLVCTRT